MFITIKRISFTFLLIIASTFIVDVLPNFLTHALAVLSVMIATYVFTAAAIGSTIDKDEHRKYLRTLGEDA